MLYDFDVVINRRQSECAKWNAYDEDILPLPVADMDFYSPQPVLDALHERVEHGIFGYPEWGKPKSTLMLGLQEVILDRLQRRYGWTVSPDALVFFPGVVAGLNVACNALAGPGAGILIQPPVYPPFLHLADNSASVDQQAQLLRCPDGKYEVDFQGFQQAFTPQSKVFVLCNPHNPVGRVFRQDELERMAAICLERGVTIVSDEIHCDLLFSGQRHIPIASLDPEISQNTITLMAPSKTFNLAGLFCSFAVIENPDLRRRFIHTQANRTGGVGIMGLVAAEAAYRNGQEWLDQLLVYLEGNRDYMMGYINEDIPGVRMSSPEGTYLAWLDCREAQLPEPPYEFFLKKARLALGDGKGFGAGGDGFVRLNFGCPRSILAEALDRMRRAVSAI